MACLFCQQGHDVHVHVCGSQRQWWWCLSFRSFLSHWWITKRTGKKDDFSRCDLIISLCKFFVNALQVLTSRQVCLLHLEVNVSIIRFFVCANTSLSARHHISLFLVSDYDREEDREEKPVEFHNSSTLNFIFSDICPL